MERETGDLDFCAHPTPNERVTRTSVDPSVRPFALAVGIYSELDGDFLEKASERVTASQLRSRVEPVKREEEGIGGPAAWPGHGQCRCRCRRRQ